MLSRRKFLQEMGAAAVAAVVPEGLVAREALNHVEFTRRGENAFNALADLMQKCEEKSMDKATPEELASDREHITAAQSALRSFNQSFNRLSERYSSIAPVNNITSLPSEAVELLVEGLKAHELIVKELQMVTYTSADNYVALMKEIERSPVSSTQYKALCLS